MATSALPLGSWEADRQKLVVAPVSDYGDVSDLPDDLKFQVHVSRMIRKRENQPGAETSGAAAFVLVTAKEQDELRAGRVWDRMIHTGTRQLSSRVHFVTPQASSSAQEEYIGDDNALFERVAKLGFDDRPALLYVPSETESSLTYYPKGTRSDEELREVILHPGHVTEAEILETLQAIYSSELCTPDNMGPIKLWKNAGKGYPIKEAERTVQQMIRHALVGRFLWCTVRQEQPGKSGRTDLEIVDDRTGPPGTIYHHALLELKVLRSFGSTGKAYDETTVREAIFEGVNQAHSYGSAHNSVLRMLCCYDMRSSDVGDELTFAHVKDHATTLSIRLKRWYLYRTSQAYRNANVAQKLMTSNGPTTLASVLGANVESTASPASASAPGSGASHESA